MLWFSQPQIHSQQPHFQQQAAVFTLPARQANKATVTQRPQLASEHNLAFSQRAT